MDIIAMSKIGLNVEVLRLPNVTYLQSAYIAPKMIETHHLYLPKQLFVPIKTDKINVVVGSSILKATIVKRMTYELVTKNQNVATVKHQIINYISNKVFCFFLVIIYFDYQVLNWRQNFLVYKCFLGFPYHIY